MRRGLPVRTFKADNVTAVFVEIEAGSGDKLRHDWPAWGLNQDIKLEIVPSPFRSVVGPFLEYLERTDQAHNDGRTATVLLPEFVPAKWQEALLHNQTAWLIKIAVLYQRRRSDKPCTLIDVPIYLRQ